MNQPKFKFGETVKSNKYQYVKPFTVKRVDWGIVFSFLGTKREGYRYFPDPEKDEFWPEEDLALYQEPQKKKLYAYYQTGYASQVVFAVGENEAQLGVRVPEYDIEYPIKVTEK